VQPIGQRLLPDQDVAAADVAPGVVVADLARQVQPERDDLAPVPSGGAGIPAGRFADVLTIDEEVAVVAEIVGRPGERRRTRSWGNSRRSAGPLDARENPGDRGAAGSGENFSRFAATGGQALNRAIGSLKRHPSPL